LKGLPRRFADGSSDVGDKFYFHGMYSKSIVIPAQAGIQTIELNPHSGTTSFWFCLLRRSFE